ncbi:MOB member 4, phocein [Desmophyllum pertusum]|uniref:MOB member 4, phocein n=1 Tax=Desmophyllum pertusum TaxID=174260 RepID=A0A9W9YXD1_9CNID|nr:MOB member 4, phocein [Desmophyllum pertusum]
MELNGLAVKLQTDCTPATCTQNDSKQNSGYSYVLLTKHPESVQLLITQGILWMVQASLLNSNKYFPSRVSIKESSVAKLGSVCRRVYRIFSHAFFHHRSIYDEFENETLLCKRFTIYVLKYDLMAKKILLSPWRTPCHRRRHHPHHEDSIDDRPMDSEA